MIVVHYAFFVLFTFTTLIMFSNFDASILLFAEKHFKVNTTNVFARIGSKIFGLLFILACSIFWPTTMFIISFGERYLNIIRSIKQHVKSPTVKAFALSGCTIIALMLTVACSIFWPISWLISTALDGF